MKIGQLAKATGTQVENIRFYETEGLLPKALRTDSNYRVYDDTHVSRLAFIRHCRSLDMTLANQGSVALQGFTGADVRRGECAAR